jgi:hypothetical protein
MFFEVYDIKGGIWGKNVPEQVLRRTSGSKNNEVTLSRRKLQNEDFRNLYFWPNIIRILKPMGMK